MTYNLKSIAKVVVENLKGVTEKLRDARTRRVSFDTTQISDYLNQISSELEKVIEREDEPLTIGYMDTLRQWHKIGGLNPVSGVPVMYSRKPIRVTFVAGSPFISIVLGQQGVIAIIKTGVTRERLQQLEEGLADLEITPLR